MKLVVHKEVDAFIETLQKPTRSKWVRHLILLEQYGKDLGMPHVRHIKGNLRELRIRGKQEVRALFVIREDEVIIVHAFIKKTQQTPRRELDTAQKRIEALTGL